MKPAYKEGMKLRHCQPGRQLPYHQPATDDLSGSNTAAPFQPSSTAALSTDPAFHTLLSICI